MNLTEEQVKTLGALADAMSPKNTKKRKAKKAQFLMAVNGVVCQNRVKNKKAATEAATKIILNNPSAKIELFEYVGNVNVDVPVAGVKSLRGED
jgi:hypothetical protein